MRKGSQLSEVSSGAGRHSSRQADLSPATIVTLYLSPGANLRLRPMLLEQLRPGSRIVSHEFGMGQWAPARVERMVDESGVPRLLHLWRR